MIDALVQHLWVSLKLQARNKMALIYGYLFPTIFLAAFWVLYRHEKFPLLRHLGELLTVSVLGGACFGLPTTMVSERERGVWRRYRLSPVPVGALIFSTMVTRYLIVLSAGGLQFLLARVAGMPAPAHPLDLWIAFTFVAFAFIGLGLVIAALADNVPAVQALGQCIFLPMLIIGGVAVQLASLPNWAQHVSAFFPGRYAVEALQATVTGDGIRTVRFCLVSLGLVGCAGCVAGTKLFRWETGQRFVEVEGKPWLLPALAAWLTVGLIAEGRGRVAVHTGFREPVTATATISPQAATAATPETRAKPAVSTPAASANPEATRRPEPSREIPAPSTPATPAVHPGPSSWEKITSKDVEGLDYSVPPDGGVVAPIAPPDETPDETVSKMLDSMSIKLVDWPPGRVADVVQRVRNHLYVAGVPDVLQLPIERFVPSLVQDRLEDIIPKNDLVKILCWIVMHPDEGTVITDISDLGVEGAVGDPSLVRERAYFYGVKMLARLTGRKLM